MFVELLFYKTSKRANEIAHPPKPRSFEDVWTCTPPFLLDFSMHSFCRHAPASRAHAFATIYAFAPGCLCAYVLLRSLPVLTRVRDSVHGVTRMCACLRRRRKTSNKMWWRVRCVCTQACARAMQRHLLVDSCVLAVSPLFLNSSALNSGSCLLRFRYIYHIHTSTQVQFPLSLPRCC